MAEDISPVVSALNSDEEMDDDELQKMNVSNLSVSQTPDPFSREITVIGDPRLYENMMTEDHTTQHLNKHI